MSTHTDTLFPSPRRFRSPVCAVDDNSMTCLRWICLVACALVAGPAAAGACRLRGYGTFPVSMVDGDATTVVKINGIDTRFTVDTGNFFNAKIGRAHV